MMNAVSNLRPDARSPAKSFRLLRLLIDQVDLYRRYVLAGAEVETLLSLSDRQLAARGLTRGEVGRATLKKHGIDFSRTPGSDHGPADPGV